MRRLFYPLLAGLLYFAGARLGVTASALSEGIAMFWLPNGVLLAALLLARARDWPTYLLAAVAAEIVADLPTFTLLQALGFAAANLFECLLAATLLRLLASPFRFDRLRNVVGFGLVALILAPGLAALPGAVIYHLDPAAQASFWFYWRVWWVGDSLGVLLVVPLVLSWFSGRASDGGGGLGEAGLIAALGAGLSWYVFAQPHGAGPRLADAHFLLLPVILWAAIRFGVRETAALGLIIAIIAIVADLHDLGPFLADTPQATVLNVQMYLMTLLFSSLALAALLQELRDRNARLLARDRALRESRDAIRLMNLELESRVESRTAELQEANRRLEALASIDPLTGASNRRHFLETAQLEVERAVRLGLPMAAIMLDLDHFKRINDTYGHEAGDCVLQTFAQAVRQTLRSSDIFARLGGEEFLLLLPGQDQNAAGVLAERLRSLTASLEFRQFAERITVSIGIATLGAPEINDLAVLMRQADRALYQAKNSGRNQVVFAGIRPQAD